MKHRSKFCDFLGSAAAKLTVWLLLPACFLVSDAGAVPITYRLTILTGAVSGTVGTTPFSNANMTFTFEGDTANVIAFSAPVTGAENLIGTASFEVLDQSGNVLAQGTFLPTAGIFVSLDRTNTGVGFGSLGVLPGSPTFPGNPAYPYALGVLPELSTYDLKGNITTELGWAVSCLGFPVSCGTPVAIPTTAGDLYLNEQDFLVGGFFTAEVQPQVPFSAFNASGEIRAGRFQLDGNFTLGAGSDGIKPTTEALTLQLGSFSAALPPGSLKRTHAGPYAFQGVVNGVHLQVEIAPRSSDNTYRFKAEGYGSGLNGIAGPVSFGLTIGDDSGTTTVVPQRHDE